MGKHTHYWFPIPMYRRDESGADFRCTCGALFGPGSKITPPASDHAAHDGERGAGDG